MEKLRSIEGMTRVPKYSLTSQDLTSPAPFDLQTTFSDGQRIDRTNFVPFTIGSFRISKGIMPMQYGYLNWVKINEGFDFKSTFANYLELGGNTLLKEDEKELIEMSYGKIPKHREMFLDVSGEKSHQERILAIYDSYFGTLIQFRDDLLTPELSPEKLYGMAKAELLVKLQGLRLLFEKKDTTL